MDSKLLQEEKNMERYRSRRNGVHLIGVLFECNFCHFRNMNQWNTIFGSKRDKDTLIAERRAQLDKLWARKFSTFTMNLSHLRMGYLESAMMCGL